MERAQIINRVLCCLDEAGITQTIDPLLNVPIENFIDEAGRELLKIAPSYLFRGKFVGLSPQNNGLIDNGDGSGSVLIPSGIARMISFRMEGWKRDATYLYTTEDPIYKKQFNPFLRGNIYNPVVVIFGDRLHYYSLPKDVVPVVKKAEFLLNIPVESFDDLLIDSLVWLAAFKVLAVLNEAAQSEMAHGQYIQCLNLLKIN